MSDDFDDIDDLDLDDDLEFDDSFDLGALTGEDNRKPATKLAEGAFDGVKMSLSNRSLHRRAITRAMPEGISDGYDMALDYYDDAKGLYDTALESIRPSVRPLKKLAKQIDDKHGEKLPKWLSNRIKKIDLEEDNIHSRELTEEEVRAAEVEHTLNAMLLNDSEQRSEDMKQQAIDRQITVTSYEKQIDVLNDIASETRMAGAWRSSITAKYNKRMIELNTYQLWAMRDQLVIQKEYFENSFISLEEIKKNTGLPDYVKLHTSEAFWEIARDRSVRELVEPAMEGIKATRNNILDGLKHQIAQFGGTLSDTINTASDSLESGDDTGVARETIAGSVAGDFASSIGVTQLAKWIGGKISDNETIQEWNQRLRFASDTRNSMLRDTLNTWADTSDTSAQLEREMLLSTMSDEEREKYIEERKNRSLKDKFSEFIDSDESIFTRARGVLARTVLQSIGEVTGDFSFNSDPLSSVEKPGFYSDLTDRVIREEIPRLLSEILRVNEAQLYGEEVDRKHYDFSQGDLISQTDFLARLNETIAMDDEMKALHSSLQNVVGSLDINLTEQQMEAFKYQLMQDALDGKSFSPKRYTIKNDSTDGLSFIENEEDREVIRSELMKYVEEPPNKKMSTKQLTERANAAQRMDRALNTVPDYKNRSRQLAIMYGPSVLDKSGLMDTTSEENLTRSAFTFNRDRFSKAAIGGNRVKADIESEKNVKLPMRGNVDLTGIMSTLGDIADKMSDRAGTLASDMVGSPIDSTSIVEAIRSINPLSTLVKTNDVLSSILTAVKSLSNANQQTMAFAQSPVSSELGAQRVVQAQNTAQQSMDTASDKLGLKDTLSNAWSSMSSSVTKPFKKDSDFYQTVTNQVNRVKDHTSQLTDEQFRMQFGVEDRDAFLSDLAEYMANTGNTIKSKDIINTMKSILKSSGEPEQLDMFDDLMPEQTLSDKFKQRMSGVTQHIRRTTDQSAKTDGETWQQLDMFEPSPETTESPSPLNKLANTVTKKTQSDNDTWSLGKLKSLFGIKVKDVVDDPDTLDKLSDEFYRTLDAAQNVPEDTKAFKRSMSRASNKERLQALVDKIKSIQLPSDTSNDVDELYTSLNDIMSTAKKPVQIKIARMIGDRDIESISQDELAEIVERGRSLTDSKSLFSRFKLPMFNKPVTDDTNNETDTDKTTKSFTLPDWMKLTKDDRGNPLEQLKESIRHGFSEAFEPSDNKSDVGQLGSNIDDMTKSINQQSIVNTDRIIKALAALAEANAMISDASGDKPGMLKRIFGGVTSGIGGAVGGVVSGVGKLTGGAVSGLGSLAGGTVKGMGKTLGTTASVLGSVGAGVIAAPFKLAGMALKRKPKTPKTDKPKDKKDAPLGDVYVGDEDKPRLYGYFAKAGRYLDKLTGKVVKTVHDITGEVIDRQTDETKLTEEDIKQGVYEGRHRKPILKRLMDKLKAGIALGAANLLYGAAKFAVKGIYKSTAFTVKQLIGKPTISDVYVKGETSPRLIKRGFKSGWYVNDTEGGFIRTINDLKDKPIIRNIKTDEIVITQEDYDIGLTDRKGNPVGITNIERAVKFGVGIAKGIGKRALSVGKSLKNTVSSLFNRNKKPSDVTPTNTGTLDGTVLTIAGIDQLATSALQHKQLDLLKQINVSVGNLRIMSPTDKPIAGDFDGDGDRDNSWRDRLYGQQDETEDTPTQEGEQKEDKKDSWLMKLISWLGPLLGGLATKIVTGLGALFGGGAAMDALDAMGGADLPDGKGKNRSTRKPKGKLGKLVSGVKRAGGAIGRTAMKAAPLLVGGAGLLSGAASAVGSAASAVGTGLAAAGSATVAAVGAPVLIAGAVIAAVAIGGFVVYKRYFAKVKGGLNEVRLAEYGIKPNDESHVASIIGLEKELAGSVQISGTTAKLNNPDLAKIYEGFGVDPDNAEQKQAFLGWFAMRFKPVYLRHMAVRQSMGKRGDLVDLVDGLSASEKIRYLSSTVQPDGSEVYEYRTSPWLDDGRLKEGGYVNRLKNRLLRELRKLAKDEPEETTDDTSETSVLEPGLTGPDMTAVDNTDTPRIPEPEVDNKPQQTMTPDIASMNMGMVTPNQSQQTADHANEHAQQRQNESSIRDRKIIELNTKMLHELTKANAYHVRNSNALEFIATHYKKQSEQDKKDRLNTLASGESGGLFGGWFGDRDKKEDVVPPPVVNK